jgi:hypothetical protein
LEKMDVCFHIVKEGLFPCLLGTPISSLIIVTRMDWEDLGEAHLRLWTEVTLCILKLRQHTPISTNIHDVEGRSVSAY